MDSLSAAEALRSRKIEEETKMRERVEAIGYPLPEDIEKLKWYGDFDGCLALIDQRMAENIPETLREKLRMEQVQIQRMRQDYVVTPEEANCVLGENLRDWKPEELEQLRRENVIDWIFVKGQVRYIDSFYSNLIKIRGDLAARQLHPRMPGPDKRTETEIRNEIIAGMKAHGGAVCTLKIRSRLCVSLEPGQEEETLRVWLPYPLEKFQVEHLRLEQVHPAPVAIAPADAVQRTVYFEGNAESLKETELVYTVENRMRYVEPDPDQVSPEQPDFDTGEQLPHIVFTPYLRDLTVEVLAGETNPLKKARRIYDFITQQVNYSYMRGYISLPVIPEYCASRLRGDCGVQALTFITMCRIAGIPARWQSGLYSNENGADSHDWAMFYVAPYGWLWADCSYGGAAWRDGALERWDFYFGNLDPYRVVLTSEFQGDFTPQTQFLRSDPYDNQRGEVEFSSGPVLRRQWEGGSETLSCKVSWLDRI